MFKQESHNAEELYQGVGHVLTSILSPFLSMKRMKGGDEDGGSSSSSSNTGSSSLEPCKKVRVEEDKEEATAAGGSTDSNWARLPQELLLHIFQYLPLLDRAYASQVCRGWNQAFHMPELWRCFEFELNQPASSYLKATHPDLIKQIIKRHSNHLQYVSFKVTVGGTWCGFYSGFCVDVNSVSLEPNKCCLFFCQVDSSTESAEAACDILSQLVNCSLKTLGLISTARPSFMEVPKVPPLVFFFFSPSYSGHYY